MMSRYIKRKSGRSANNHPRSVHQTSHRPRGKTSRQTLRRWVKRAKSSEVTIEQNNSAAISEPSLLYRSPTPSADTPSDVDSKMTLGHGGNFSENETKKQCLCDDSENFTTLTLSSDNVALCKGKGNPRAAEKDGK